MEHQVQRGESFTEVSLDLSFNANGTVLGTVQAADGNSGTLSGTFDGRVLRFTAALNASGCFVTCRGFVEISGFVWTGAYEAGDCTGRSWSGSLAAAISDQTVVAAAEDSEATECLIPNDDPNYGTWIW